MNPAAAMSIQHSQYIVSWIYYTTLRQSWSNVVLTLWLKRGFNVLYYVCDVTASLQRCHNVECFLGCSQIKFLHEDVKKTFSINISTKKWNRGFLYKEIYENVELFRLPLEMWFQSNVFSMLVSKLVLSQNCQENKMLYHC